MRSSLLQHSKLVCSCYLLQLCVCGSNFSGKRVKLSFSRCVCYSIAVQSCRPALNINPFYTVRVVSCFSHHCVVSCFRIACVINSVSLSQESRVVLELRRLCRNTGFRVIISSSSSSTFFLDFGVNIRCCRSVCYSISVQSCRLV